jgi:large subunit ribosomal protein L5
MSQQDGEEQSVNPMQKPRVEKVVVNIAVGESGEPLQRAVKVLNQLTGQTPCQRKAKRTIRDFGIHRGEPIACLVTLRKGAASDFLKRTLNAIGNRLNISNFDVNGNFSFGVSKHIDLDGVRYNPELGIFGMDVCVTLRKPGYRVKKRRINRAQVGKRQRLTQEEAVEYMRTEFGIDILGE